MIFVVILWWYSTKRRSLQFIDIIPELWRNGMADNNKFTKTINLKTRNKVLAFFLHKCTWKGYIKINIKYRA